MKILEMEKRLLRKYNVNEKIKSADTEKNRRNFERYHEIVELNNITTLFVMLLY
jgi:hypothetical protein